MSRRYGRNQRRRHREAIARLEDDVNDMAEAATAQMLAKQAAETGEKVAWAMADLAHSIMQETIERIRAAAGEYTALTPPKERRFRKGAPYDTRMAVPCPVSPFPPPGDALDALPEYIRSTIEELHYLALRVERRQVEHRTFVHWIDIREAPGGKGTVAYAFSDSTYLTMGFTPEVQRQLAREIAKEFCRMHNDRRTQR